MKKFTTVLMAIVLVAICQSTAWGTDYSDYVTGRGDLVAYYQFEEQSGTAADNAEGTAARDGSTDLDLPTDSVAGPRTADGFSGLGTANNAFTFDGGGTAETVTLPAAFDSSFTQASRTFSAFVKYATGSQVRLFEMDEGGTANDFAVQLWDMGGADDDSVIVQAGTVEKKFVQLDSILADNNWHHLVITHDASSIALYIDGVSITSAANNSLGPWSGDTQIGSGAGNPTSQNFNGEIDEVAFFSTALSGGEVEEMYRTAVPAQDSYSTHVLDRSDLVAYYKFDELSGTAVDNAGGTASYDGTTDLDLPTDSIGGARAADGFSATGENKAFDFDGNTSQESVTLPAAFESAMDYVNGRTFSAFVKYSSGLGARLFEMDSSYDFAIQVWSAGEVHVTVRDSAETKHKFVPGSLLADDNWHHLVVVHDTNSSPVVAVYVDGVAMTRTGAGTAGAWGGDTQIGSGAGNSGSQNFDGGIDNVAFFSTALTADEVMSLYNAALPRLSSPYADAVTANTNLVAYYPFDEQSGSSVAALSTNATAAYDGTTDIPLASDSVAGPRSGDGFTGMSAGNNAFDFGATASTEVTLTSELETAIDRTNLTFTAFVKLNASASNSRIFELGSGCTYPMVLQHYDVGAGNKFFVALTGNTFQQFGTGPINDQAWHHLAVVRNGTVSTADVVVYVDGVALSKTGSGGGSHWAGLPRIGTGANAGSQFFNGRIDDVAFFSYAMTAEEVEALYLAADPVLGTVIVIR